MSFSSLLNVISIQHTASNASTFNFSWPSNFKYGYEAISYVDDNGAPSISGYTSLITQATTIFEGGFGTNAYDLQTEYYLSDPGASITVNGVSSKYGVAEAGTSIPFTTIYTLNSGTIHSTSITINATSLVLIMSAGDYQSYSGYEPYYVPPSLNCTDYETSTVIFGVNVMECYSTVNSTKSITLTANTSADDYPANVAILKADYSPTPIIVHSLFKEEGLPTGTTWAVDYGGRLSFSNRTIMNYSLPISYSNESVPIPFVVGTIYFANETFTPHNSTGYLPPGGDYTVNFIPNFYIRENLTSTDGMNTTVLFKDLAAMNSTLENISETDGLALNKVNGLLHNMTDSLRKLNLTQANYMNEMSNLINRSVRSLNYTISFAYAGKFNSINSNLSNLTISVGRLGRFLNDSIGAYEKGLASVNSSLSANFKNISISLSEISGYLPKLNLTLISKTSNNTAEINDTIQKLEATLGALSMQMLLMDNNSKSSTSGYNLTNHQLDDLNNLISTLSGKVDSLSTCNNYYSNSNYTLAEKISEEVSSNLTAFMRDINHTLNSASTSTYLQGGFAPLNSTTWRSRLAISNFSGLSGISQSGSVMVYRFSATPGETVGADVKCGGVSDAFEFLANDTKEVRPSGSSLLNTITTPLSRLYSSIASLAASIESHIYGI